MPRAEVGIHPVRRSSVLLCSSLCVGCAWTAFHAMLMSDAESELR